MIPLVAIVRQRSLKLRNTIEARRSNDERKKYSGSTFDAAPTSETCDDHLVRRRELRGSQTTRLHRNSRTHENHLIAESHAIHQYGASLIDPGVDSALVHHEHAEAIIEDHVNDCSAQAQIETSPVKYPPAKVTFDSISPKVESSKRIEFPIAPVQVDNSNDTSKTELSRNYTKFGTEAVPRSQRRNNLEADPVESMASASLYYPESTTSHARKHHEEFHKAPKQRVNSYVAVPPDPGRNLSSLPYHHDPHMSYNASSSTASSYDSRGVSPPKPEPFLTQERLPAQVAHYIDNPVANPTCLSHHLPRNAPLLPTRNIMMPNGLDMPFAYPGDISSDASPNNGGIPAPGSRYGHYYDPASRWIPASTSILPEVEASEPCGIPSMDMPSPNLYHEPPTFSHESIEEASSFSPAITGRHYAVPRTYSFPNPSATPLDEEQWNAFSGSKGRNTAIRSRQWTY